MFPSLPVLRSSLLLSLLSFSCLASLTGQATPAASPFAGAPFALSAAELKDASVAVPVSKEFSIQILYEEGNFRITADGRRSYQHRLVYRVDAQDAIKGWSEVSLNWDPWYQNQAQLHARVLQPSGAFAELDPKTVTDAPVKGTDAETYSTEHERRAPLPGIVVGSIVEETESVDEKIPYFASGSIYRWTFRWNVPLARSRLVVELPSSMPYKDQVHHDPGLIIERTDEGGKRRVVYEGVNLPARHDSDIDLATDAPTAPIVEFATGASWAAVAGGYSALADPQTILTEAQPILPANLPVERMAKIRAIVKQLHHEVRYTGVEFGAAKLTPQHPSEVIQRHYGDCKDKANLLVAMLRAAGVPANLALLSTGPGRDVDPLLPGIDQFDHAIVYVPAAAPHEDPLWIDATAEYFAVGSLPYDDEGRNALVISPQTTQLTRTPAPRPEDSVLIETRTFKLAGLGPSHVEEVSETHGYVDATYRDDFGGPETPKQRENLQGYVKETYLAKTLTSYTHGDAADFDHPFQLTVVADGAKRGVTSLVDGVVVIFPAATTNDMPKWLATTPPQSGPDISAEARRDLDLAQKSRPASFVFRPYIYEQRVRILVPAGFTPRSLPRDKTTQLGSATLTESYSASEPGVVTVTFRFNSGPGQLTADQALAMRTALVELHKREYVGIFFDQSGAKALTAGHIREALEIDRNLIASQPTDALHHLHLARAVLDAGIGGEAQSEARRATELDPKLSAAYETLGWTLEHNQLGERFGRGFDRAGAIAAFKRAIELDPTDNDPRFDLAILDEFDAGGSRYAPGADLAAAIQGYKDLIELNKDKGDDAIAQYRENLLYAMVHARQFAELDKMLATLPSTNSHRVLAIASAAAQHGADAGIAQADAGNNAVTDRNKNLRTAGTLLADLHLYTEAASVMSAGMQGGDDAASAARRIELYKSLKPASLAPLPANNPAAPLQSALVIITTGNITHDQMVAIMSKHAYSSPESLERDVQKALSSAGFIHRLAERSEMSESVMIDLILGNTTFTSKGDDQHGWAVISQGPGSEPDHTFVVKEDGAYRIVAGAKSNTDDNKPLGLETLWALSNGKPEMAKAMLDWKRDLTHKAGGDDPFEGPLLPRFWTIGSSKPGADSPEAMRLAAISLLAGSMDAKPYLAEIAAARDKATGQRQTDLDLLLAVSAINAEQPALGMPAAQQLLEQEPDSAVALDLVSQAYMLQNDAAGLQALLGPRLQKKPDDHDLLSQQVRAYEIAHDFKSAQAAQQKVLDSGKATASDYNSYAWLGLFHDDFGDDIVKAAQQGSQMLKNSSFAVLHTLACIYAVQGKTTEAREVLKQAMDADNMVEPNSAVWYALGLVYEQYGAKSAALDAYRHVTAHELDDHTFIDPTSTYVLAQDRIHVLAP